MSALGPQIERLYDGMANRVTRCIGSVHSSAQQLSHSCAQNLSRMQNRVFGHHHRSDIITNDPESNEHSNGESSNNSVEPPSSVPTPTSRSSSSGCNRTRPLSSSLGRSSNHRRSHRRERSQSFYRHSYPYGLISIRTIEKDRNVLAAVLSIVVIAVLATALAQFKWFSIYNDLCESHFYSKSAPSHEKELSNNNEQLNKLLEQLPPTSFQHQTFVYTKPYQTFYTSGSQSVAAMYGFTTGYNAGCASPQILALKRTIIGLCFLAIMCSLIQFFMDIMGSKRKWVNSMRTHAVFNIVTVLLCVLIIGLCYFVSILYERVQLHQLFRRLRQIPTGMILKQQLAKSAQLSAEKSGQFDILTVHQVKFELSYYLVTLAGFLSILAAAANLFRRPRQIFIEQMRSGGGGSRNHRHRPHGDESSLLGSDLLNNEPAGYFPYPYSWMYGPNWSVIYNYDAAQNNNTTNNNNNNSSNNGGGGGGGVTTNASNPGTDMIPPPPPPLSAPFSAAVVSNCPPPPPYTP